MDLKPCPFCGSEACAAKDDHSPFTTAYCRTPDECCHIGEANAEDAIRRWNTRPREDALQAEVERLRTLVAGGLEAVSAAYQQALAEAQNHDRIADKHDKVVMAWKREARAALKGAPHE